MQPQPGLDTTKGTVPRLNKAVYGTRRGRVWYEDVWGLWAMLAEMGYTRIL